MNLDEDVMMGKPVIVGTRITVELILKNSRPANCRANTRRPPSFDARSHFCSVALCGQKPSAVTSRGMNLLADESIDRQIVARLARTGTM